MHTSCCEDHAKEMEELQGKYVKALDRYLHVIQDLLTQLKDLVK